MSIKRKFSKTHLENLKKAAKKRDQTGEKNPCWRGGKRICRTHGYVFIRNTIHSRSVNGYVREHILVVEKMIGRPLKYYGKHDSKNETIHHIDFDKTNNKPENLYVTIGDKGHRLIEKSLFNLVKPLLNKKIIKFNKEKKIYELFNK